MNSTSHLAHLSELVRLELQSERDAYNRSLTQNISGRTANGDCLYPVQLAGTNRNSLDQLIVKLRFDNFSDDDLSKGFEPGRPAIFFTLENETTKDLGFQCHIDALGDDFIDLQIPNRQALMSLESISKNKLIGLRAAIDETSYRVMLESLHEASRSDNANFIHLRETLIGNLQPQFRDFPPTVLPWLNASQQAAVQKVLEAKEVSIIHGPPGTGKTTTLIEAIIETLQRETQVLVCAPSNIAVDWISSQLTRRGVNVLRIGNPLRMSDEMLECSYERRYAAHPDYHELWNIRKILRQGFDKGKSLEKQAKLRKLRERQTELEIKINADLFNQARVVACTLIGSAYKILDHKHFTTLFIDEAAQALEPACWSAILKSDRVILCGDHQQLPPTVKSHEAAKGGLERTLMQRVAQEKTSCLSLLTTQYRMNQQIMNFSSRWFYHGQLVAAHEVADRLISPMDTALTWMDTSHCQFGEKVSSLSFSKSNAQEAKLLIHILQEYIEMIGLQKIQDERVDFGIIAPYKAQIRLLRKLLKMQKFYRHLRHQISVNTVDGFQGQERDVMILSMVRDNDQGDIGFLRDLRRMNVAMTRARMKLIIVGNSITLSKHKFYNQLIEHFKDNGNFIECQPDNPEE